MMENPGTVRPDETLKSVASLSWALALLTFQQFSRAYLPGHSNEQMKSWEALQQEMAASACSVFTSDTWITSSLMRTILDLTGASAGLLQGAITERKNQASWREFQNKLHAFYLFQHVVSAIDLPAGNTDISLPELTEKARSLGPYDSVWTLEGLGHYYARLYLRKNILPSNLLRDSSRDGLPAWGLLPLHTGMGLALAEFLLRNISCCETAADCFREACQHNSQDGYVEAAYEALGLVVRNLFPDLVGPIHTHLSKNYCDLLPYFWHGAGRAIYFSPVNLLPYRNAPWKGMEMCADPSWGPVPRRNMLAGFAWAMFLVNLKYPEVLDLLLECHAGNMPEPAAFMNGIYSAAVVWRDCAPQEKFLQGLCNRELNGTDQFSREAWGNYIQSPVRKALDDYPYLSASHRIGCVFRSD